MEITFLIIHPGFQSTGQVTPTGMGVDRKTDGMTEDGTTSVCMKRGLARSLPDVCKSAMRLEAPLSDLPAPATDLFPKGMCTQCRV